ncbi:MAG: MBL fold metallo-hydrolase [Desulfurococcaceae archaeon]
MEVLKGVFLIRGEISNIYLVAKQGGYLLVDAGSQQDPPLVISSIESLGLKPNQVKHILVTHYHWDHINGLPRLKEYTGAKVVAHKDEEDLLSKEGVSADILLSHGDIIAGFQVIHSPGHTPGSACYLDLDREALFVGDLVYEENKELHEVDQQYTQDPAKNRESIANLLSYKFKHVMPGHGDPLLESGLEKLQSLVKRLKTK